MNFIFISSSFLKFSNKPTGLVNLRVCSDTNLFHRRMRLILAGKLIRIGQLNQPNQLI